MAKSTIVLVPGAWHKPDVYSGIVDSLSLHMATRRLLYHSPQLRYAGPPGLY